MYLDYQCEEMQCRHETASLVTLLKACLFLWNVHIRVDTEGLLNLCMLMTIRDKHTYNHPRRLTSLRLDLAL